MKLQWALEKRRQVYTFHYLTQSGERYLSSLSRKTTSLRFVKLRLGTQFMAPGGPVFALVSYASAGDSGWKTTSLRSGELRRGRQVVINLLLR